MITAIGFAVSILIILFVARKSLPLGLFAGALILGLFTLPVLVILETIYHTLIDLSVIFLSLAVGVIPMIGGVMKQSGQMDRLVDNMRIGKKWVLALSPAMMGLLPMPGGALFSAPIVEKAGSDVPDDLKAAINNWFRHLFVLIYPLSSALITAAKIANLNIYTAVLYLTPFFGLTLLIGYLFFLRRIKGRINYPQPFNWKGLLIPLAIIVLAPAIDFVLKKTTLLPYPELATLIAVSTAFLLAWGLARGRLDIGEVLRKMKPWNFALIIIGMFIFLNIFKTSDAAGLISSIPLPMLVLGVLSGFALGLATGRVILPASIILPIYLTARPITPFTFSLIYTSMFFGYVISPIHPCICVTIEYFRVSLRSFLKLSALPALIVFVTVLLISVVWG